MINTSSLSGKSKQEMFLAQKWGQDTNIVITNKQWHHVTEGDGSDGQSSDHCDRNTQTFGSAVTSTSH